MCVRHSCAIRWMVICALALAGLQTSYPAFSAPTIEDYAALPAVSMMAISPSGDRLAFRRISDDLDALVVLSLSTGETLNGIELGNIKPQGMYFLTDDRLVLQTSEHRRMPGYRDSFEVSTAFVFSPSSGTLNQLLTPGDNIIGGQMGMGRIVGLSADQQHVYMPAFGAERRSASMNQSVSTDTNHNYSLMRVNLEQPRRPATEQAGSAHTIDYFVGSQGNWVAEELFNSHTKVHSVVLHGADTQAPLFRQETSIPQVGFIGLTADESALVIRNVADGRINLSALSLDDGSVEPLLGRSDADVQRVLSSVNRVVHGVEYGGFRPSYEFLDRGLNQRMDAILAAYPDHAVTLVSWSDDWQHLVIKVEGNDSAGDYMLHSTGNEPRFLASGRPQISSQHINPIFEFAYPARDGLHIPALLTVPQARQGDLHRLPAVMLPHGGPAAHDRVQFDWLSQALASQGYLVIQPQFRGSTGFGLAHQNAGRGEWGKKMQDDLTDALQILDKEGLIDPKRVCIVGWSYGGYAALAGGAFTPELYQCVVSINGVSDLPRMMSTERGQYGKDHWVVAYWEDSIARGAASRSSLRAVSPVYAADQFKAPVLLIHGENDSVVDHDQAKTMRTRLRRAKKPVQLVTIRNDDHNLFRPDSRLQTLKSLTAFLDKHIGDRD